MVRLSLLLAAAVFASAMSLSTAEAGPRNCGPGMNSDGYRCVPIVPRDSAGRPIYGRGYDDGYRHGYRRAGPRNCGPGMNSDGYGCVPIEPRDRFGRYTDEPG